MARPASLSDHHATRPAHAVASRWSPFDFVGRMSAVLALLPVSRKAAQAMLPAGLELAAQEVLPRDRHLLVLIMGKQSEVRPRAAPLGASYLEFILAVPFVGHPAGGPSGPFCYCPRLFLDRGLPTLVGRLLYGYAKRRATIRMTPDSYSIAEPSSAETLLEAHFRTAGAAVEASRSGISTPFALPVISEAAGGWRYSCADFGLERALVQPVQLDLAIHRPFVSGLPVGEFRIAGLEGDAARALRIRTSWQLAGPWARRSPPHPGLDKGGEKR